MAIKSGFFNSVDSDRKYDAEDMNEFFDGLVNEGVFSTIGDTLLVSATTGLQIVVGSGRAWFLKSWIVNTVDKFLTLDAADLTYPRYDAIVLDMDKTLNVRENDIIIVKGTPAASPVNPSLISSEDHLQKALAYIYVDANETVIEQIDITNNVGESGCPFVTALLDHVTIEELLVQWRSQFDAWMTQVELDLVAIDTGDVLDELAEIRARANTRKNFLINGDMGIAQREGEGSVKTNHTAAAAYTTVVDRWRLYGYGASNLLWRIEKGTGPDGQNTFLGTVTTLESSIGSTFLSAFCQDIESSVLASLHKGTSDAKDMTLSFLWKSNVSGTFIVEVKDWDNDWSVSIPFTSTGDGNWETIELLIPKETTQALQLDEGAGLGIAICLGAGSNYTAGGSLQSTWGVQTDNKRYYGQTSLVGAASNYFEITDVQLELGSQPTIFERVPFFKELALVQRYSEWHDKFEFLAMCYNATSPGRITAHARAYAASKRSQPDELCYSSAATVLPTVHTLSDLVFSGSGDASADGDYPAFTMWGTGTMVVGTVYECRFMDCHWDSELTPTWRIIT